MRLLLLEDILAWLSSVRNPSTHLDVICGSPPVSLWTDTGTGCIFEFRPDRGDAEGRQLSGQKTLQNFVGGIVY